MQNVTENISSLVKGKFYKLHEALSNYKVKVFSAHIFFFTLIISNNHSLSFLERAYLYHPDHKILQLLFSYHW